MGATRDGTNDDAGAAGGQPTYEELSAENRRLKAQIQKLLLLIEKLRRESKRQAAPFRKQDQPAAEPKTPGRKSGRRHGPHAHRAVPPRIDESYDVALPQPCPRCGDGRVRETHIAQQYQTEIPRTVIYRRFDVHVGVCATAAIGARPACVADLDGPWRGGESTGSKRPCRVGDHEQATGLVARQEREAALDVVRGAHAVRGTSARSIARTAERCEPAYEQLRQDIRGSPQIVPDETGWRVGGRTAWLHAFVGRRETCYRIDPTRSGQPAEQLLGLDWSGTLVHDGWSVYDRFTCAAHQQCLAHLQRRCEELLETAARGAVRLPRAVLRLIDRAYALRRAWRGHRLSGDDLAEHGLGLACELEQLAPGRFTHEPNRRLAGHLLNHAMHWFWFLIDPAIDATNYRAEQAIRPAVVNRKVWGGNRTWRGARWQGILSSVIRTCEQRARNSFDFLLDALCRPPPQLLPA